MVLSEIGRRSCKTCMAKLRQQSAGPEIAGLRDGDRR